jgi:hypothetical protein
VTISTRIIRCLLAHVSLQETITYHRIRVGRDNIIADLDANGETWIDYKKDEDRCMWRDKKETAVTIAGFLLSLLFVASSWAVPGLSNYQGKLLHNGAAVTTDTPISMTFKLFIEESDTGGSPVWMESQAVDVVDGIYAVKLGAVNPFDSSLFDDPNREYWLEVTVNGEVLSPRQRFTSVPFAFNAETLDGYTAADLDQSIHVDRTDNPHQVTAAQVGAATPEDITWSNLAGIPADLADGDDVGITAETDPTVLTSVKDGISWSEITSIPPGFADGVDNNSGGDITGVTAGTGLTGGGSSGDVTLEVKSPLNLSGDLTVANNLGIGLLNPNKKLYVMDDIAGLVFPLKIENHAAGDAPGESDVGILFSVGGSGNQDRGKGALVYEATGTWNRGSFHFLQDSAANSNNPDMLDSVMTITNSGKVGIGTAPESLLHISSGTSGDAIFLLEADIDNNNEDDQPGIQFRQDGGLVTGSVGFDEGSDNLRIRASEKIQLFAKDSFQNDVIVATLDKNGGHFETVENTGRAVYGTASGIEGFGVYGVASNAGHFTNYGGYFEAAGDTGRGVYGIASNTDYYENYGGYFEAAGRAGRGVYGEATGALGRGVYGKASDSDTEDDFINYGGYFESAGQSGRGVFGKASNGGDFTNYGGNFEAAGTYGRGVYGDASGTSGTGVYGFASNSSNCDNYGGSFVANGTRGTGVYGTASGDWGIGVEGKGGMYDFYASGSGVNYGPFTGAHEVLFADDVAENIRPGLIVSVTGRTKTRYNKDGSISLSSTLPTVYLPRKAADKAVFGVLVSKSPLPDHHWYKTTAGEYFGIVNALGEGRMWVTDINGDIEAGDYVTSSNIPGYGQRQDDNLLHSYTVGKAIESVDWSSVTETVEYKGIEVKVYLIAVVYTSG